MLLTFNKLYEWQEFSQISTEAIDTLQIKYQDKIFKAGTSFAIGNRNKVLEQLQTFLKNQISAFAVADSEQTIITIFHQIPEGFQAKDGTAIIKFDRSSPAKKTESPTPSTISKFEREKSASKSESLTLTTEAIVKSNSQSRKIKKQYRGREY